jgi:uncharacterized protein YjiS (DUF1127 family)
MCIQVAQESALTGRTRGYGAPPEKLSSTLSAFLNTVAASIARSGQRRALCELAQDTRLLSDIGLTREQALREAGRPFWF